jgi:hypothetical protein
MAKKKLEDPKLEGNATMSFGGKSISISNDNNEPVLTVINEYGNSVAYRIATHSFDSLWSQLWQFVKEHQH